MLDPTAPPPPPDQLRGTQRRRQAHQVKTIVAWVINHNQGHRAIGRAVRPQTGIAYPGLPRTVTPGPIHMCHEVAALDLASIGSRQDRGIFPLDQEGTLVLSA